ncbi:GNAT family N-acetyltransferase [Phenylobacterium sp. Root700]|uniref:GNAT family N-acetyltransferase n=1 Tax=Phenylobacterium sp. Root700 TaxID=1736591 RepID=UPI0009EC7FB4|nr:GNAT family protein [Phenylobacterium sp. Root700]
MNNPSSTVQYLAQDDAVAIRRIHTNDLGQIARFGFTVSITEPLTDRVRLADRFEADGFWRDDAGALAMVEVATGRLLGTTQFYRSGPCIHGCELGYIIHDPADRGRGYAPRAVSMFADLLFAERPAVHRLQLMIEVWNTPSWKLAERCGFVREGLLRSSGLGEADPGDSFLYARTRRDWREQRETKVGG